MKYQSLRPSWSWSYYPNYHVTGDGNVALLNWPRLCVLSHNQAGSSSPSFVFDFVFVFCHTSNLVPISLHHHRMIVIIIIYEDQVTNGYEAYQMIVFGELVHWPPWADVLSRLSMSSSSFLIIINCHHHKCHHNWQHWQQYRAIIKIYSHKCIGGSKSWLLLSPPDDAAFTVRGQNHVLYVQTHFLKIV